MNNFFHIAYEFSLIFFLTQVSIFSSFFNYYSTFSLTLSTANNCKQQESSIVVIVASYSGIIFFFLIIHHLDSSKRSTIGMFILGSSTEAMPRSFIWSVHAKSTFVWSSFFRLNRVLAVFFDRSLYNVF